MITRKQFDDYLSMATASNELNYTLSEVSSFISLLQKLNRVEDMRSFSNDLCDVLDKHVDLISNSLPNENEN